MSGLSIDATAQAGGPADGRVLGATLRLAMSGDRERAHYALAKQHVADAEARIARQREIIEALRAAGRDSSMAQTWLEDDAEYAESHAGSPSADRGRAISGRFPPAGPVSCGDDAQEKPRHRERGRG
jgi:hypothetical protein